MALWTVDLYSYGGEMNFAVEVPDSWNDQQVYDYVMSDIEIDITKEDS